MSRPVSPISPADAESAPIIEKQDLISKVEFVNVDVQETSAVVSRSMVPKSNAARRRIESLGIANLVILILCFVVTVVVTWYIAFLWYYSPGLGFPTTEPPFWREIVLRQWVQVSITISTAILRAVAGLQLGVTLSIIAALMLEKPTVPVRFAPLVLTLRGTGTASTWSLLEYLFDWKAFRFNAHLSYAAILLIYTSIAAQLSSTFLISDLGMNPVLSNSEYWSVPYALTPPPPPPERQTDGDLTGSNSTGTVRTDSFAQQQKTDDTQYWTSEALDFPVFAEHSVDPPAPINGSLDPRAYDTGQTLRGFPPFRTASLRASLSRFEGYTTVFDTRVTCITPMLNATLEVGQRAGDYVNPGQFSAQLSGSLQLQSNLPEHVRWRNGTRDRDTGILYNCSVSFPGRDLEAHAKADWAITICNLNKTSLLMDSPILRRHKFPDGLPTEHYIVINATGSGDKWRAATRNNQTVKWQFVNTVEPWTRMVIPHSSDIALDIGFCVNTFEPINIPTVMTGGKPGRSEPLPVWDAEKRRYNMSRIVKHYAGAALPWNGVGRSILNLTTGPGAANWTDNRTDARAFTLTAVDLKKFRKMWSADKDGDAGAMLCTYCENFAASVIRSQRLHASVFQEVLNSTGSLPLAMQTLLTILTQRAWYDFLPEFDISAPARYSMYGQSQIPVRYYGMVAVLVIIFVQNVAVFFVVLRFLCASRLRLSIVGNLWQSFGQFAAGDVAEVATDMTMALDKEVMRELKTGPIAEEVVELVQDDESGVLRLLRKRRRGVGADAATLEINA